MAQVSAVDDVITGLISVLDSALSIPVYDGLEPTSQPDGAFVVVGSDGDPDSDAAAAVDQAAAAFEAGTADEQGRVSCLLVCQSGDLDLSALRAASRAHMLTVEQALRADPSLGGRVAAGAVVEVTLRQARTDRGAYIVREFTYAYMALQA